MEKDTLDITFDSGAVIRLADEQSCCENRYITCDDDLQELVGQQIMSVMEREGGSVGTYDITHEIRLEGLLLNDEQELYVLRRRK